MMAPQQQQKKDIAAVKFIVHSYNSNGWKKSDYNIIIN